MNHMSDQYLGTQIRDIARVDQRFSGRRLDWVAAHYFDAFSRSKLQSWIKAGRILVNGQAVSTKYLVKLDDLIELDVELVEDIEWQAVPQEISPLYEDEHILVVNKPAGLVVHPAAGHARDTLVNAFLHLYPELRSIPRAGIVHRLDKDTSGLLVVARSLQAHKSLVKQLESRIVARQYKALAQGEPITGGTIDAPIGRHPKHRIKMSVRGKSGKCARTHYRVAQRFNGFTLLDVKLDTGRTHQIRVHLSHIGLPLLGDPLYGARLRFPKSCPSGLAETLSCFKRQALHAFELGFEHPATKQWVSWQAPIPDDMSECISVLASAAASDT